jgi:hypothetical protein
MNKLRVGSIIYQLRHGTAEERLVIEAVENDTAFCKELKFNANYEGSKITLLNQSFWLKESFGNSYAVPTLETVDRFEKEIILRFIRNSNFSSLSLRELVSIKEKISSIICRK